VTKGTGKRRAWTEVEDRLILTSPLGPAELGKQLGRHRAVVTQRRKRLKELGIRAESLAVLYPPDPKPLPSKSRYEQMSDEHSWRIVQNMYEKVQTWPDLARDLVLPVAEVRSRVAYLRREGGWSCKLATVADERGEHYPICLVCGQPIIARKWGPPPETHNRCKAERKREVNYGDPEKLRASLDRYLEQIEVENEISRSMARKTGEPWTDEEDTYLIAHPRQNDIDIALALGRSTSAVRKRTYTLRTRGLLVDDRAERMVVAYQRGMPVREIADSFDVTPMTVYMALYRADVQIRRTTQPRTVRHRTWARWTDAEVIYLRDNHQRHVDDLAAVIRGHTRVAVMLERTKYRKELGIARPQVTRAESFARAQRIRDLLGMALPGAFVAQLVGVHQSYIADAKRRVGLPVRAWTRRTRSVLVRSATDRRIRNLRIVRDWRRGMSATAIADAYGLSSVQIYKILAKAGYRRREGESRIPRSRLRLPGKSGNTPATTLAGDDGSGVR